MLPLFFLAPVISFQPTAAAILVVAKKLVGEQRDNGGHDGMDGME